MKKYGKGHAKPIHLKYQLQQEMASLIYLMDQILYQIF